MVSAITMDTSPWNISNSIKAGSDYANSLFEAAKQRTQFQQQQRAYQAQMQAGGQFAQGDYSGAAGSLAQGDDIPGAVQTQQAGMGINAAQADLMARGASFVQHAYERGGKTPQAAVQAYDYLIPQLHAAGIPEDQIFHFRANLQQDPQGAIQAAQAFASKTLTAHTDPAGNTFFTDQYGNRAGDVIQGQQKGIPLQPEELYHQFPNPYEQSSGASPSSAQDGAPPAAMPSSPAGGGAPQGTDPANQVAYNYFLKQGWSPTASAAIVGNLAYESGMNPNQPTKTPGEGGFGLAQWHGDRAQQFQEVMGKPLKGSSLQDQLAFVNYELTQGDYSDVGNKLRKAYDVNSATNLILEQYEAPAKADASRATRQRYAAQLLSPANQQQQPVQVADSGQIASDAPQGYGQPQATGAPTQLQGAPQQGGFTVRKNPDGSTDLINTTPKYRPATAEDKAKWGPDLRGVEADGKPIFATTASLGVGQAMALQDAMNQFPGLHGEDFLSKLTPSSAAEIRSFHEGRGPAFTMQGMRSGAGSTLYQATLQAYPGFDNTKAGVRLRTLQSFANGKDGQNMDAINTAIQHMMVLRQAATALKNGNIPLVNQLQNWWKINTGDPSPLTYDTIANFAANEISKASIGAGGTGEDRNKMQAPLNKSGAGPQIDGALNAATQLMAGRLNSIRQRFKVSTGGTDEDFNSRLLPDSIRAMAAVQPRGNGTPPRGGSGQVIRYDAQGNRIQ